MTLIEAAPWVSSDAGIEIFAYPANRPLEEYVESDYRIKLDEVDPAIWKIQLDDSISRFWLLFEGDEQPEDGSHSIAIVDLQIYVQPLPEGLTVAVPAVLENAGYDPTAIVRHRGTTWSIVFTDLGVLSGIEELVFTLRRRLSDHDVNSIVQVSSVSGLKVSNQKPAENSSNAIITILDEVFGTVKVWVAHTETEKYNPEPSLIYDIKARYANGSVITIHSSNKFRIVPDVTRQI